MGALNIRRKRDVAQADEAHEALQHFLTFQLRGESYAVGILAIKEILEYSVLTRVPMLPAYICGVLNLRGVVVPVVDLSVRFGRDETAVSRRTCIVIIEMANEEMPQYIGILVDAVHEVLAVRIADIEPPPQLGSRVRVDFILGMARVDERFVVLLDVEKVLGTEDFAKLYEMSGDDIALSQETGTPA